MTRKLLTAIDQVVSRTILTEAQLKQQTTEWAMAHLIARRTATILTQKEATAVLNIQRLTTQSTLTGILRLMPLIPPQEALRITSSLLQPTVEEELATRKRLLPYRQIQELETERAERIRPEQMRQTIRQIVLSRTSINLIEQTVFARLEEWLWTNFPLQTYQILGALLKQSIAKQWYVERIAGLEDLQKLMLQMYIQAFMEFPLQMNILGMKVTPLTMSVLRGRIASIYETYSMQKQDLSTKPLIGTVQSRKLETKAVVRGKSKQEQIPLKENIGVTSNLEDDSKVSTGRDLFGNEAFFTTLRYAFTMPFWLRRRLARGYGMPESHKYAKYFGIGCIPSRYAKYSWKQRRMPREPFTYFLRDEYLKRQKIYDKLNRAGVPYKGRYGGTRIWSKR